MNGIVKSEVNHPSEQVPLRVPRLWVSEEENTIRISVDMPGVKKEDLKLNIENNVVSAEGESRTRPKDVKIIFGEYGPARYARKFKIADTLDPESVEANFENGVLMLVFRSKPEFEPRKITVN